MDSTFRLRTDRQEGTFASGEPSTLGDTNGRHREGRKPKKTSAIGTRAGLSAQPHITMYRYQVPGIRVHATMER